MKKVYSAPKLSVHGNVEELTQYLGKNPANDAFQVGGTIISNTDGSKGPLSV